MPNRMIRDGLIESEAVLSLPVEARWLFVTIMLSADDLGLFEATEFKLARRADINRELAGRLLLMLADSDLIRLYEVGGKRYGFIPKFRQRIQIKAARYPLPPTALYSDDDDASKKINNLVSKTTVGQQLGNGCTSDAQPPEAKAELLEEEANASSSASRPVSVPDCPVDALIDAYEARLPSLPSVRRSLFKSGKNVAAMRQRWRWVMTAKHERGPRKGQRLASSLEEGVSWFDRFFGYVSESDFLTGKSGTWTANLAWLMTASNFEKVLSGVYHSKAEAA